MRLTTERSVWRDIPDDPDNARVEIRHIKPGEQQDIEDNIELYRAVLRPDATGALQREVTINPAKGDARYAFLCAAIKNWENFLDAAGIPLACTDENKILMARERKDLGQLVGTFRTELAAVVSAEQEAERKNLKS